MKCSITERSAAHEPALRTIDRIILIGTAATTEHQQTIVISVITHSKPSIDHFHEPLVNDQSTIHLPFAIE